MNNSELVSKQSLKESTPDKKCSAAKTGGKLRRKGAEKPRKSPERLLHEQQFQALYDAYMRPKQPLTAEQELSRLEELCAKLEELNTNWVEYKAGRYRALDAAADGELALRFGCDAAREVLIADKQQGNYIPHMVAHYSCIVHRRVIDYFRKEFRHCFGKKPIRVISREAYLQKFHSEDEDYQEDRLEEFSCDPFGVVSRPRKERDEYSRRIGTMFLRHVLESECEPRKTLAMMYGSILFQIAHASDSQEPLDQAARKSTAMTSTEWAFRKMGDKSLDQLGTEAVQIAGEYYQVKCHWGEVFERKLEEKLEDTGARLGDQIYTRIYKREALSKWIEEVRRKAAEETVADLVQDSELLDYVMGDLGSERIRNAIKRVNQAVKESKT